ncbi:hypothetical protein Trisim1_011297 [Trichoderma cf. simile WF8]
MVRRALSIILAAKRPLTLSEMNIAMNINDTTQEDTTTTFDDLDLEDDSDFKSRLRSLCGLFISIYHGKVYFLHQTAREFLLGDLASPTTIQSGLRWHHSITARQAHNILAELCVLYLNLFNSILSPTIKSDREAVYLTDQNTFLTYSSENWAAHFFEAQIVDGAAILPVTLKICDTGSKSFSAWYIIYQRSIHKILIGNLTDLIIASYHGHSALVKLLIEKGADMEAQDDDGQTPLSRAAENGHEATVKVLIEKGADVEAMDNDGAVPLWWAAENGHEATVKLLIEKGANIEAKDRHGQAPLSRAAQNGHEAVVKLLVEKGANIETKDRHGQAPLSWAAEKGHEAVVKLLIERGANIWTKDIYDKTPPSRAAVYGHVGIMMLLLEESGKDADTKLLPRYYSIKPE